MHSRDIVRTIIDRGFSVFGGEGNRKQYRLGSFVDCFVRPSYRSIIVSLILPNKQRNTVSTRRKKLMKHKARTKHIIALFSNYRDLLLETVGRIKQMQCCL